MLRGHHWWSRTVLWGSPMCLFPLGEPELNILIFRGWLYTQSLVSSSTSWGVRHSFSSPLLLLMVTIGLPDTSLPTCRGPVEHTPSVFHISSPLRVCGRLVLTWSSLSHIPVDGELWLNRVSLQVNSVASCPWVWQVLWSGERPAVLSLLVSRTILTFILRAFPGLYNTGECVQFENSL